MFVKNQNIVVIFELNTYKLAKNNIINDNIANFVDICKILMRILFIMHIIQHSFIYN